MVSIAGLSLAAALIAVDPASAQVVAPTPPSAAPKAAAPSTPIVNVYTTLDLESGCKRARSDTKAADAKTADAKAADAKADPGVGGRWQCGGPKGFEVLFAEDDLRQFLGYGAKARAQRSAQQTLAPFNSIFRDGRDRATIQWRGTMQAGKFVPFATIVRYHVDTGDDGARDDGKNKRQRSQVLVVTKLGAADGSEACHLAYIDAVANKDALVMAAQAADERAPTFNCKDQPVVLGTKGTVPAVVPMRT